jgi:hypothetical protein
MSHFTTLVIMPKESDIEDTLNKMLAPYDENMEVDSYERDCYYLGSEARRASVRSVTPDIDYYRDEWHKKTPEEQKAFEGDWEGFVKPYADARKKAEEDHPLYQKPDADCEDCNGSGKTMSEYNPQSKWDWWVIGGRWQGGLTDYEPSKEPENIETCPLCHGTGERVDEVARDNNMTGCNGCENTGKRVKWPSEWKEYDGDVQPISVILENDFSPFAILTPEGWSEKGEMGWWGIVTDEKDETDWQTAVRGILDRYKDGHIGVLCDLHI